MLIPVVKELARLHSPGHTKALLHGLQELIANIDSNSDIDVGALGEAVKQLALWVESLESQLADNECCDCLLRALRAGATHIRSNRKITLFIACVSSISGYF